MSDEDLDLEERGRHVSIPGDDRDDDKGDDDKGATDKDEYGRKVRRRINKEVARRKSAESQAEKARREAAEAKKRLAELAKAESERDDAEETELKEKMKKALEDTELDTYHELNVKLHEATRKRIRRELQESPKGDADTDDGDGADPDGDAGGGRAEMAEEAKNWIQSNPWFDADDPDYDPEKRKAALRINRQLMNEGYDVHDSDLYEEIDRRLAKKTGRKNDDTDDGGDDVDVDDDGEGKRQQRRKQASPAAPPGGDDAGGEGNKRRTKSKLTQQDLQSMSRYGFNPNDPEDRKKWLARSDDL